MTVIAVQMSGLFHENQILDDMSYLESYTDLAEELQKKGALMIITKENRFHVSANTFSQSWLYGDGAFHLQKTDEKVDVILNKDSAFHALPGDNVINHPDLDLLCNDKPQTAKLFPQFFPLSLTVQSATELPDAFRRIPSAIVAIKPVHGYGGHGVWIGPKAEAKVSQFPCLLQEFIDTSKGIDGVTTTTHDFRLIIADGNVIFSFLRTPKKGKLVSNYSQGGWMMPVPARMRPAGALALVKPIDRELERFGHRLYSIDCGLNADGRWMVFELNAPPGQQSKHECGEEAGEYFEAVTELLLKAGNGE